MGTETGGNPDGCKNKDIDDPDSGEDEGTELERVR